MLKNIKYTLLSLFTVFKHIFKSPVTLEYPEKKRPVGDNFRGKLEVEGCIKCGTCLKVCPTGAIIIEDKKLVQFPQKMYVLWKLYLLLSGKSY